MSRPPAAPSGGSDREVVYGRNPVRELIAAGRRPVHEVRALPRVAGEPWLAGLPVRESTRDALSRWARSPDHQGVAALTDPYPYAEAADLLDRPGPVVCLDGAHDPRNIGAIARVAECAGAAVLAIPRRGGPGVTPTVAKASAGAVEWLAIVRVGSVAAFVHDARSAGRQTLGADPAGGEDYRAVAWSPDPVIVLGSEGEGLRPRVRDACDGLVSIPTAGHVASLNISVAAGILVFEAVRNTN
jgi:23S rRNA (guanosine2251-2'-O)-methyltransferase